MRTYFCQPLPNDDGFQWNSDFEVKRLQSAYLILSLET